MNEYEWYEIYEARFGKKLNQHEVEIWDSEIKEQIKDCNPYEIVDAVRSLAEQKRKGELKYQVTVNNIISEIIKARYLDRQPQEARELTTKHEEQLNKWKYRIRNAPTVMDKWEIICAPDSGGDCMALEKFVESLPSGFTRPTVAELRALSSKVESISEAWKA